MVTEEFRVANAPVRLHFVADRQSGPDPEAVDQCTGRGAGQHEPRGEGKERDADGGLVQAVVADLCRQ